MFCIPTVYIYEVWLENVTVKFPHFKLKINTKHVALLLIKKKAKSKRDKNAEGMFSYWNNYTIFKRLQSDENSINSIICDVQMFVLVVPKYYFFFAA